jgi:ribosome-binding protein aMBF1 (putative translation factor)
VADRHSTLWRRPGRRDEERKRFTALLRRVEAIRVRNGWSKTDLAREIGTTVDVLRAWVTGQALGRKESVAKLKVFLTKDTAKASGIALR